MFNISLKNRIMGRVYTIWTVKKIATPVFAEAIALLALAFWGAKHVFVFSVLRNAFGASDSVYSLVGFFANNFILADVVSKIIFLGIVATLFFLGTEMLKTKGHEQASFI